MALKLGIWLDQILLYHRLFKHYCQRLTYILPLKGDRIQMKSVNIMIRSLTFNQRLQEFQVSSIKAGKQWRS